MPHDDFLDPLEEAFPALREKREIENEIDRLSRLMSHTRDTWHLAQQQHMGNVEHMEADVGSGGEDSVHGDSVDSDGGVTTASKPRGSVRRINMSNYNAQHSRKRLATLRDLPREDIFGNPIPQSPRGTGGAGMGTGRRLYDGAKEPVWARVSRAFSSATAPDGMRISTAHGSDTALLLDTILVLLVLLAITLLILITQQRQTRRMVMALATRVSSPASMPYVYGTPTTDNSSWHRQPPAFFMPPQTWMPHHLIPQSIPPPPPAASASHNLGAAVHADAAPAIRPVEI